MKKGNFVLITGGEFKGKQGQVIRRDLDGNLDILIDLDGDPETPPVSITVPSRWAKALKLINFILNLVLPLLYNIKRK